MSADLLPAWQRIAHLKSTKAFGEPLNGSVRYFSSWDGEEDGVGKQDFTDGIVMAFVGDGGIVISHSGQFSELNGQARMAVHKNLSKMGKRHSILGVNKKRDDPVWIIIAHGVGEVVFEECRKSLLKSVEKELGLRHFKEHMILFKISTGYGFSSAWSKPTEKAGVMFMGPEESGENFKMFLADRAVTLPAPEQSTESEVDDSEEESFSFSESEAE